MALFSSFLWSVVIIITKKISKDDSSITILSYQSVFMSIFSFFVVFKFFLGNMAFFNYFYFYLFFAALQEQYKITSIIFLDKFDYACNLDKKNVGL